MKSKKTILEKLIALFLTILIGNLVSYKAAAQCATGVAPVYTKTCSVEFYQSINATGVGVVSTISVSGITSCTGTYINDFATQGITTAAGNTVNLNITRPTGYTAYLTVYIDWNNNGTFDLSELCGTLVTIPNTVSSATYTFIVPTSGLVVGINLPMRVFLSEGATGDPCNGTYGQTYDFNFKATCPSTIITVAPAKDSICIGGTGDTLTATGAGTGGVYTWIPAAGLSATTGAVVIASPTVAVVYTVTGTTSIGCKGTAKDTIVINPSPAIPLDTALGLTKFCFGTDSVVIQDTTKVSGYTYQWYNGITPIAGATDTSYLARTSGSYVITQTNSFGCASASKPLVITVNPLPNPVITFDGKIFRTAKYYTSYQWYENKVLVPGATYDSIIAKSNGNYQVKVTDTNGCSDTSSTYILKHLDVDNTLNNALIKIYPNPTSGIIHIDSHEAVNAVVSGIEGKLLIQAKDTREVNVTALPDGIYMISLYDRGGHRLTVQKLIKN